MYDAMVELESYYSIGQSFDYREGYAPIFWCEGLDYVLELEYENTGDQWSPSNQKKG